MNRLGRTVFRLEGLWELYEERLELSVNSELLSLGVPSLATTRPLTSLTATLISLYNQIIYYYEKVLHVFYRALRERLCVVGVGAKLSSHWAG